MSAFGNGDGWNKHQARAQRAGSRFKPLNRYRKKNRLFPYQRIIRWSATNKPDKDWSFGSPRSLGITSTNLDLAKTSVDRCLVGVVFGANEKKKIQRKNSPFERKKPHFVPLGLARRTRGC